ncbi:hypothetical protein BT96DRAFT_681419 [Gymnopus androsaceus JB14]|uniref:Uncharacterized protein n=1 Tax=Gymnopus androsaceus JB14 TaxID=1447944 RepID=A0A6A4HPZ9_9AGAR|nr:hypothetical protein BT96DRAFT_681419 [Gymnopus androsaceus JB14]
MPRDKMIQQGHGDGLDSYKALFDKQKDINSELRDSLSDLRNRSKDLVETLGFDDIMQARVYLETQRSKGQVVKYRDRFREIDRLQDELKDAKALIQKMESREKDLEEENSVLRQARDESGSAYRKLTKEHKNLEDKYHDAVRAHEAAALLREKDMAKWKSFKQWIFCAAELAQFQKYDEEYGFSGRDKAKELFRIVTGKKYKLSQLDTLDDEKLFDLCGQNMDVHLPSPPTVLNRSSDLRSVPFSPSSKVNQQKSSPSLSLNSNATPTPHALVGLYARKNNTTTPVSTKAERRPDHNIGTLNVHSPEGESRAFVSPLLPTAAASKPAIILAPDSSQDQSQRRYLYHLYPCS